LQRAVRYTLSTFVHLVVSRRGPAFSQRLRGFRARGFYEKWKYLPGQPGKVFLVRQFMPSAERQQEISAGADFPSRRKIDV
jgi:hypothetical protein